MTSSPRGGGVFQSAKANDIVKLNEMAGGGRCGHWPMVTSSKITEIITKILFGRFS